MEVANNNAQAWRRRFEQQADFSKKLLEDLSSAKALLKDLLDTGTISCGTHRKKARELLKD